jgi:hypothetical protein
MSETFDRPNVVIHPPIAWALAFVVGLAVGWLYPLRFVPTSVSRAWIGGGEFAIGRNRSNPRRRLFRLVGVGAHPKLAPRD